jgi:hypothetical protein
MTIAMLFWILFIIGFIFHGVINRSALAGWAMDSLFWWVLIGLLGFEVFGGPIRG